MGYYVEVHAVIHKEELHELGEFLTDVKVEEYTKPQFKDNKLVLTLEGKWCDFVGKLIDKIQELNYYEMFVIGEDDRDIHFYSSSHCDYDMRLERTITFT